MNIYRALIISVLLTGSLSGCAANKGGPGSEQADTPPRLILDSNNRPTWDNLNAFGPVPEKLQQTGQNICIDGGFKRVIGYHSKAKGLDGKILTAGGYLCSND